MVATVMQSVMVLGFMFDPSRDKVVLIEKDHPDWMVGKLNGVGGKVRAGEPAVTAMVREFEEETGLVTKETDWQRRMAMHGDGWTVTVYIAESEDYDKVRTNETEKVGIFDVDDIPNLATIPNLKWIVAAVADVDTTYIELQSK